VSTRFRSKARQKAERLGHAAEWRAVWRLRLAGYSILARRYKTRLGEIDIVARRGDLLAFVEVKARTELDTALFALQGRQFGRVARAASLFIANHPRHAACSIRFDAVLVGGGLWPRHLPGVWQPPE
jgi:putative endonuclease